MDPHKAEPATAAEVIVFAPPRAELSTDRRELLGALVANALVGYFVSSVNFDGAAWFATGIFVAGGALVYNVAALVARGRAHRFIEVLPWLWLGIPGVAWFAYLSEPFRVYVDHDPVGAAFYFGIPLAALLFAAVQGIRRWLTAPARP